MSRLHFEEARTEEQFAALSLIHALGWRTPPTSWPGRSPMTAGSPHSGKI